MNESPLNQLSGSWHHFEMLNLILSKEYSCAFNASKVYDRLQSLWQGERVNFTEDKRALFIAQRQYKHQAMGASDAQDLFASQDEKMLRLVDTYSGITHVVCVGVGGSSWGIQCLDQAFKTSLAQKAQLVFIDHCDASALEKELGRLEPSQTLVVYITKSGLTHEVRWAYEAIEALWENYQRVLVTANKQALVEFNVHQNDTLLLHDEVNGRMSIWSPVIFPILLAYGANVLDAFRLGGCMVDQLMQNTLNVFDTLPGKLANAFIVQQAQKAQPTLWMLTYARLLDGLGPYVQQLLMESLGKPFNQAGEKLIKVPGPVVMPMTGHQAQHAAIQYLHQSDEPFMVHAVTLDIADNEVSNKHLSAQYRSMTENIEVSDFNYVNDAFDRHRRFHDHSKQVSVLSLKSLTPKALGALIAVYEYVTLIMGFHAEINPFDQFGVERPKAIMKQGELA